MSLRAQKVLIYWTLIFAVIWALTMIFLMHMLPPPSATWSPDRIAQFYGAYNTQVKIGAVVTSWTGGCLIPIVVVIGAQMFRHERHYTQLPVWTIVGLSAGMLTTIFVVLPPVFFGAAAFTVMQGGSHDAIALAHTIGVLSLITTEQFYMFLLVAAAVLCLTPNSVPHSPFSRWYGYFSLWVVIASEPGALAYLVQRGPIAWNGLLPFWNAVFWFLTWLLLTTAVLLKAISAQAAREGSTAELSVSPTVTSGT